jgi:hypothetical protein
MLDNPNFIVSQDIPAGLPDGLRDALHEFIGERTAFTDGMTTWLEARIGAKATARIAEAAEAWWFWQEEAGSPINVLVGLVVLSPALDDLPDDAWWFAGDDPPEGGVDNPGAGLWGYPILVADRSTLNDAQTPYIAALRTLAKDFVEEDWAYCESCDGLRPGEDRPCLDGCPVEPDEE